MLKYRCNYLNTKCADLDDVDINSAVSLECNSKIISTIFKMGNWFLDHLRQTDVFPFFLLVYVHRGAVCQPVYRGVQNISGILDQHQGLLMPRWQKAIKMNQQPLLD